MRRCFVAVAAVLVACAPAPTPAPAAPEKPVAERTAIEWPAGLPVDDHVVIVVEENKNYEEIIGSPNALYINKLSAEGGSVENKRSEAAARASAGRVEIRQRT